MLWVDCAPMGRFWNANIAHHYEFTLSNWREAKKSFPSFCFKCGIHENRTQKWKASMPFQSRELIYTSVKAEEKIKSKWKEKKKNTNRRMWKKLTNRGWSCPWRLWSSFRNCSQRSVLACHPPLWHKPLRPWGWESKTVNKKNQNLRPHSKQNTGL